MATTLPPSRAPSFGTALSIQLRVIGALILRELHTRYGRENVGYLWLIGEPMMLASVMGSLHHTGHTAYGSDISMLTFTVLGYTTYITFRGIVNRSAGALEANAPLLYHRMVTALDIILSRAILEWAGVFLAYVVLMILLCGLGLASPPVRPLYLIAAQLLMLWYSFANSLIITAITHDNRTMERIMHPYTYFMIPLSGAFYQVSWVPEPYRHLLLWIPLPHILELARYGQFKAANLKYFDGLYVVSACVIATWIGLICVKVCRAKVHLH